MATVWTDPDFNPKASAFYYARVIQIPTPRHSLYDAVALNRPHPKEYPTTIQERAYRRYGIRREGGELEKRISKHEDNYWKSAI
jgi:hypothetical protein